MIKQIGDILGIHDETQLFLLLFASAAVLLALIIFIIILVRSSKRRKKKETTDTPKEKPAKEKKKNVLKEQKETTVIASTEKKAEVKEQKKVEASKKSEESKPIKSQVEEIKKALQKEDQKITPKNSVEEKKAEKTEEEKKEHAPATVTVEPKQEKAAVQNEKVKSPEELRKEIEEAKERIASREENLRKIQERLQELGIKSNDFYSTSTETKKEEKLTYNESKKIAEFDNEGGAANQFPTEIHKTPEEPSIVENPVEGEAENIDLEKTNSDKKRIETFVNEGGSTLPEKQTNSFEKEKTEENVAQSSIQEQNNEGATIVEDKEMQQAYSNTSTEEHKEELLEEKIEAPKKEETKFTNEKSTEISTSSPKTFTEWLNSVSNQ